MRGWKGTRGLAWFAVAAALAATPSAIPAQNAAPVASGILNTPGVNGWRVYGPGQTHKLRKDGVVQGGGAMRVVVTAKPAMVNEIGAAAPIAGAIAKGDKLVLAIWVKLAAGQPDASTPLLAMIQLGGPPFSPILTGSVVPTTEWKLLTVKGVSPGDYAAGTTEINLHLGGAVQTMDLGPAFVMRL